MPFFYTRYSLVSTRLYHVCIVGSGPAGFYTAQKILKEAQRKQLPMSIDMIERLPTPYGLVRYGVAPDHPEVKQCIERFEHLLRSPMSSNHSLKWFGGITVGKDVLFKDLCQNYDSVVLAIGAQKERMLQIPGESTLSGVYNGQEWIGWVNGYPQPHHSSSQTFIPDETLETIKHCPDAATVVGNGNVALDVARLLLLTDRDILAHTDISTSAYRVLKDKKIQHVYIVGRRGPLDVSFTAKELREIMTLCQQQKVNIYTNCLESIKTLIPNTHPDRSKHRVLQILQDMNMKEIPTSFDSISSPSLSFLFFMTPYAFLPSGTTLTHLGAMQFQATPYLQSLSSPMSNFDNKHECLEKGSYDLPQLVTIPCSTVFKCIGSNVSLPGDISSYFGIQHLSDQRLAHNFGRVIQKSIYSNRDVDESNIYVVGWCKTGPKGTLAATVADASETGDTLIRDLAQISQTSRPGRSWLLSKLNGLPFLTFEDWTRIDALEKQMGAKYSKSREKITDSGFIFQYKEKSGS
jgi:adrenodoxin-NADP+ reductase